MKPTKQDLQKAGKHTVTVLLTATVLGGMLAACGGGASESEEPAETPKPTETTGSTDAPAPAKDVTPPTIDIFTQFSGEAPPENSRIEQEIEKLTGANLEITWVPNTAYTDKMNATLASGELPQVLLVTSNRSANIINAVRAGAFWEIGPYLDRFPNLSKLKEEVLYGTSYDGKVFMLPRARDGARHVVAYRKDWLEALGLPEPKTIDDMYTVAKAFVEQDPDKNGQKDTIGFLEVASMDALTRSVGVYFGAPYNYDVQDNKFVPSFTTPEFMEALKFYRKLYAEQIMNQDFALMNTSQQQDTAEQGKVGMLITVDNTVKAIAKNVMKADPNAKFGFIQGLEGPKGVRASSTGGYLAGYMISKSSVKTEEELLQILDYFDKISTPEGMTLLQRGMKDVDYTVDGDLIVPIDDRPAEDKALVSAMFNLAVAHHSVTKPTKLSEIDAVVADLVAANEKVAIYDPSRALISNTATEKGPELEKTIKDAQVKFVMGQIDEAAFQKAVEDWRKNGGDAIVEELSAEYAKSPAK
jgi:putative aldouronate transport system substrate-binding protein